MSKIVQLAVRTTMLGDVGVQTLIVLTDDGRVLEYAPKSEKKWNEFPPIPPTGALPEPQTAL